MGARGAPGYCGLADDEPLPLIQTPDLAAEVADALGIERNPFLPCLSRPPEAPPGVSVALDSESQGAASEQDPNRTVSMASNPAESRGISAIPPEELSDSTSMGAPDTLGAPDYPRVGVSSTSLPSFTYGEGDSEAGSWRSPTQVVNSNH